MSDAPFLSAATAAKIAALRERGLATRFLIGDTFDVVLYRDSEEDGTAVALPPQKVLLVWPSPSARQEQGVFVPSVGQSGELQRGEPFDVQRGDRFILPSGAGAEILSQPVKTGPVVRVSFRAEG